MLKKGYDECSSDPRKFSNYGAMWLEIAKLDKVWMAAVKEVGSKLQRVSKL